MACSNVKFIKNKNSSMNVNIDCKLNNLIVTPLTCSAFIMELIKLLVYEKLQIPYPYSWLKSTVNRRKKAEQNDGHSKTGNVDRCYKTASMALEFLDNLSTQLHKEFKYYSIHEIVLCFGANIATPTEAYNIVLPNIIGGHIDANHLSETNKTVHKILRTIVLNEEWLKVSESTIPPTNMHVLIKKRHKNDEVLERSDYFLPKDEYRIPRHTRLISINLSCLLTEKQTCCANLEIFQDMSVESFKKDEFDLEDSGATNHHEHGQWFQAKFFLKGYKDTFIDSRSISNMW